MARAVLLLPHRGFGLWGNHQRGRKIKMSGIYTYNGRIAIQECCSCGTQKLRDAEARETALRDQLEAAAREAETVRAVLLRDRHRFANGVCPCCNRSFDHRSEERR